jgi:hypothetical protein
MLGGARRPPPPNYLALTCRALEELLRIDKRLLPFMAEQKRALKEYQESQVREEALRKVYGPCESAIPNLRQSLPPAVDIRQLLKDEEALARTRALAADLRAKLARNR